MSRPFTRMQAESSWHWRIQVLSPLINCLQLWHRGLKNTLKSWSKVCQVKKCLFFLPFLKFTCLHVLIELLSLMVLLPCWCVVLKSSHGSANLSVLGNRSVKNESSPSVERQVCSATLFQCNSIFIHPCVYFTYSGCIFFRPLRGGRAQKVGKTRRRGNLWAVQVEPLLLPLAVGCLRTGWMEDPVIFFCLHYLNESLKCWYSDCILHNCGISIITWILSSCVHEVFLFCAKCDINIGYSAYFWILLHKV